MNDLPTSLLAEVPPWATLDPILDQLPFVIWVTDREGVFRRSQGGGLKALGLKSGEVVGRSLRDIYPDHPEFMDHQRQCLGGESFHTTTTVEGATFESTYTPLKDETGAVNGVLGMSIDVTSRVGAERQMLDMRRSLDALLDIDRTTFLSSGAEQILKAGLTTAASVIGTDMGAMFRLDGDSLSLTVHCGLSDAGIAMLSRLPLEQGLVSKAIERKEVVVVAVEDYPTASLMEQLRRDGIRQLISAPMIAMGKVLGGITLARTDERPFTQRERDVFLSVGIQLASALRIHLLFEERERARVEADLKLKEVVALNHVFQDHLLQTRDVVDKLGVAHAFSGDLLDKLKAGPAGEQAGNGTRSA